MNFDINDFNTCGGCKGAGRVPSVRNPGYYGPCAACGGSGRVKDATAMKRMQKARDAFEAFKSTAPDVVTFLDDYEGRSEFVNNIKHSMMRFGSLTEKQVAAVRKNIERARERFEERENAPEVVEGKQVFEGEVLSLKETSACYDYRNVTTQLKMLVKDARGFKLYGSVPKALVDDIKIGDTVKISATVKKSKDNGFGFFSRPYAV